MKTPNSARIAITGAAFALLLAGCGGSDPAPADPTTPAPEAPLSASETAAPETPTSDAPDASASGTVPATTDPTDFGAGAAAIMAAELEVPNSQAISIDLDDDGNWEVEVIEGTTEHDIKVGPEGAEILEHEQDDADSDDVRRLETAAISLTDAIASALATVDNPKFDDAELEEEGERIFWKIDLESPDQDIYVDALTGEVFNS